MYLPKPWTLNQDVLDSEFAVFEQTTGEHGLKSRICVGLVALLYEELLRLDGEGLPEVYPVNTNNRAQKFLILAYTSSAFLYSSTILDLAMRGRYVEAEALTRALLETSAIVEYFSKETHECLPFFESMKGRPNMKKIFKFLKENGDFPQGGPEKVIARFHSSAHSNIHARMRSWVLWDEDNKIAGFRVHQYDSASFVRIAHHLIMPLLGMQQSLYTAFEDRMDSDTDLYAKWELGRPINIIRTEFPDLSFKTEAH